MIIANNKKAFFDYFIEEKYEAGIELKGSEVKSIKAGKVSIKEAFVRIINDEIFIMGMSVVPWEFGSVYNPEERRVRKLLLHRKEIKKIHEKVKIKGYTIVFFIKNIIIDCCCYIPTTFYMFISFKKYFLLCKTCNHNC